MGAGGFSGLRGASRMGWRSLRASDADRDRVAARLREHCAAGRLTVDEVTERLGQTFSARTLGELAGLTADLPEVVGPHPALGNTDSPSRTSTPPATLARSVESFSRRLTGFAVIWLVMIMVWTASGTHGSFWPVWWLVVVAVFVARRMVGPGHHHHRSRS